MSDQISDFTLNVTDFTKTYNLWFSEPIAGNLDNDYKCGYAELKANILSGAYSANQGLNTTDNPTFASLTANNLTASTILHSDANKKISSLPLVNYPSLAELAYLKGQNQAVKSDSSVSFSSLNTTSQGSLNSANLGNISGGNYITVSSAGVMDFSGTAKITGVSREIYNQITNVTITNTVTETSLLSGIASTRTIKANTLSAGDVIIFEAMGTLTTYNNSQTAQVKLLLNSTDVLNSSQLALSTSSALNNDLYVNRFYLKVASIGATGSIRCLGYTLIHPGSGIVQPNMREAVGVDTTINTTQDIVINQTYTWGTANAGNSITAIMVHIEKS